MTYRAKGRYVAGIKFDLAAPATTEPRGSANYVIVTDKINSEKL